MKKRRKRRKAVIMVPVASMGDIAFLLIIFFMVCSNFAREGDLDLKPPTSPDIDKLERSLISVAIDKEGNIFLQGEKLTSARDIEAGVAALLHGRTEEAEKIVLFKCDRNVDREVYEPVIAAIAKGGGLIGAVGEKRHPER